jgi:uncharacterized protein
VTEQIAIVGASVRAAAASAVRAGYQVAAADLFADADLCRIAMATKIDNYPHGLLDWLERLRPRPKAWTYTGALENHPDLVDAMADVAPLWGNGGSSLRYSRSPLRLAEALRRAGLRFPEVRASPEGLPCDGTWLLKTGLGASGSGVRAFTSKSRVSQGVVFERRVAGTPYSAVYAAAGGRASLFGAVRQLVGETWLGAGEFQYCGAIGHDPFPDLIHAEIERIGSTLAQEFGLVGLFGVDLVINGEQVWTIEVNPRYTASVEVVERTSGVDAIAGHVSACRDGVLLDPQVKNTPSAYGKAILYAKQPVTIGATFADWVLNEATEAPWPALADIPIAGTTIECGHPVLTIFAESASVEKASQDLRNRVAIVERALYS